MAVDLVVVVFDQLLGPSKMAVFSVWLYATAER